MGRRSKGIWCLGFGNWWRYFYRDLGLRLSGDSSASFFICIMEPIFSKSKFSILQLKLSTEPSMAGKKRKQQTAQRHLQPLSSVCSSKKHLRPPKLHQQEHKLISSDLSSKILKESLNQQKEILEEETQPQTLTSFSSIPPNHSIASDGGTESDDDVEAFDGFSETLSPYDAHQKRLMKRMRRSWQPSCPSMRGLNVLWLILLYRELKRRTLKLLLVSYYLGELNDSLSYALGAGPLFDFSEDSDYVHSLLVKAVDEYASLKFKAVESNEAAAEVDPILEAIVERMPDKCISDGRYQQAMGSAIECRRLDKLEQAIMSSDNDHRMLLYCIYISHSYVNCRECRCEVKKSCNT